MQVYLPIAEIPVNVLIILALGLVTGILAGIFGIGGGFLATPLLMFIGIPPAIAVSTAANQITASSVSGLLGHLKKGNVDIKMGLILLIGGMVGSTMGVAIFRILQSSGQTDLVIALIYVVFLGSIGTLMLMESIKVFLEVRYNIVRKKKEKRSGKFVLFLKKINRLPFKHHFPKSNITVSLIIPIIIGLFVGNLVSIMGIGGGFVMIPAMIYILRMPPSVVVGTSLFQIIFTAGNTTFLQAVSNHTVDIVLAFLMIVSSVIGAQIGTRLSYRVNAENLKAILSIMILIVCAKMMANLFAEPATLYSLEVLKK
ncbi:MAG: sulfite exporter TauE/SafE family protein [Proteobacteria bacterium]|nr:sulfite exporter TauE/SafE family protein [Pseudomonadota bacterium]